MSSRAIDLLGAMHHPPSSYVARGFVNADPSPQSTAGLPATRGVIVQQENNIQASSPSPLTLPGPLLGWREEDSHILSTHLITTESRQQHIYEVGSVTMVPQLRLYAPQPLPPDSDFDSVLKGSWDIEVKECVDTTEWKTMIKGRHFHLGTILNPVWVNSPRVGRGYKLEDDNEANMELIPFVHTLTFALGRPTDNFIEVVPRASLHTADPDGLDIARPSSPAVSSALGVTETTVLPPSPSSAFTAADSDGSFSSTFSVFNNLREAIDELDEWPAFAPEGATVTGSTAISVCITQETTSPDTLPEEGESVPSTFEPITPDDEVDELIRAIKGERVDGILEDLYRDIDEAAAAWSPENGEEPGDPQDTTASSAESTMGILLQDVGEALLEWSVLGEGLEEA